MIIRAVETYILQNFAKSEQGMASIHYVMAAVAGIVAVALVLAATAGMNDQVLGGFADSVSSNSEVIK